jgi:hypothetical protein
MDELDPFVADHISPIQKQLNYPQSDDIDFSMRKAVRQNTQYILGGHREESAKRT